MYTLKLNYHFDAAHRLMLNYESACTNIHGHRWDVLIEIKSTKLNANGILIDFKQLKEIVNELDHKMLNEILDFNPTAENISKYLHNKILKLNPQSKVKITIWESPEASITYSV